MIITIGNYTVRIEENSIEVLLSGSKYARVREPQQATFNEVYSIKPQYVRNAVAKRIQHLGVIYLIHFDRPYKHSQHYLGFSKDLDERLKLHRSGRGAKLLQVVQDAGIEWQVVRVWHGDRYEERRLKKRKNSHQLCPVCKEVKHGSLVRSQEAR